MAIFGFLKCIWFSDSHSLPPLGSHNWKRIFCLSSHCCAALNKHIHIYIWEVWCSFDKCHLPHLVWEVLILFFWISSTPLVSIELELFLLISHEYVLNNVLQYIHTGWFYISAWENISMIATSAWKTQVFFSPAKIQAAYYVQYKTVISSLVLPCTFK